MYCHRNLPTFRRNLLLKFQAFLLLSWRQFIPVNRRQKSPRMHGTTSQKAVLFRYYYAWHNISEVSSLQVLFCNAQHLRRQLSSGIILQCTTSQKTVAFRFILHGSTSQNKVVFRYYHAWHHISEDSSLQALFCMAPPLRRQ